MKKTRGKWFLLHKFEIVIAVIFAALGFVTGLATRYDLQFNFRFDDKIDAIELLSLAATIVLAWLVASVLDKQKEADKSAKEIILKRAEELHSLVVQSASRVAADNLTYSEAANITKRIDVAVRRLWPMLENAEVNYDDGVKAAFSKHIDELEGLLTEINQPELTVENNIIHFSRDRSVAVEAAFDELRDRISTLELTIIRG
jgi:hypothetical protein